MNKKLLITIGIILVIVGGYALVTMRRVNLEKQLGHKASFREFLGLGDKTPGKGSSSGSGILSNLFTNDSATTPGSTTGPSKFNPLVSLFTSAPSTVNTSLPDGSSDNPWDPTGGSLPPGPISNPNGAYGIDVACSDVDLNIPFTPTEQDALNKLNDRFQALYSSLYDDNNVSDEQATYDAVRFELEKVKELRRFCEDYSPKITPGYYTKRVATPFWTEGTKDSKGFLGTGDPVQTYNISGAYADYTAIENLYKLHIW